MSDRLHRFVLAAVRPALANAICAAAVCISLSAGAASSIRYGQSYTGAETAQFLAYAGAKGPVLLAVQNPPFDHAAVDRVTAESAQHALSIPVQFTSNVAEAAEPSWRYVLVFDPPDNADIRDVCAGSVAARPRVASLEVLASLCQGNHAFAGARGATVRVLSAEDPGLARLVSEVTSTVFSASDIDDHGGSVRPSGRQAGQAPANAARSMRAR
jgi:hypothetical protein